MTHFMIFRLQCGLHCNYWFVGRNNHESLLKFHKCVCVSDRFVSALSNWLWCPVTVVVIVVVVVVRSMYKLSLNVVSS